jgi:tRNA-specific 2-thiouridylase
MITSRKSKSIGLFSGGLDSLLATKLVTEQGVQAVALHFRLPFLSPARPSKEEKLRSLAELVGASFVSVDVGEDYLKAVKTPQHGYARNMAPCIDCIVYLLAKAKELAREIDADFLFTGEVVGQRSHCQNKRSLKLIEKVAGVDGRLLRPLSAKLLEPTVPELTGLLRRERLLDIKGRGRRRQIRLAHEFGIIDYAAPTGGCLLIDRNYAAKVRDAIDNQQLDLGEIDLLQVGRHFRLDSGAKVVVGRNERENRRLEQLAVDTDFVCRPKQVMGPVVVLRGADRADSDPKTAARICARYSDSPEGREVLVVCSDGDVRVKPLAADELEKWRVKPPVEEEEEEGEEGEEESES